MELSFDLDDARFQAQIRQLATRDVRQAATWALNDTATEVQQHIQNRMNVVFDRPTRYTQRAFGVLRGARPSRLEVEIGERASVERRYFLKVQEHGGSRPQKAVERRIALASDDYVRTAIPTDAARIDGYGNWSSGERNQVMSQLQVGRDVGYTSNETEASRKRKARRGKARYFIPKHGLAPGVYRRNAPDDIPIRILTLTDTAPIYQPRLGFHAEAAREFWARLPAHLSRTLGRMVEKRSRG
ncbi:hypothetical protein SAMN05421774_11243 [Gemmobacter megaterium]|uniref:Prophage minor tail protein Z (GPZ) n=1 Tax=Gemmobacter megaterium TaxID=1086013 RepID=A0A1N7QIH5_9RHOB|nr:hypothetical protein [Gemmobacter megaterium]GGE26673.1 hypothetical protein GCM10011345_35850 [Gemmobacter megaterium]SIT22690.1 hypothetical protein SAMN05421774_11243 [Gemmobacter megaterium]